MSWTSQEDGITYRGRGECYDVYGKVTIEVTVHFKTYSEPDEPSFESDLYSVISEDVGLDFEIIDSEGLDFEIECDD